MKTINFEYSFGRKISDYLPKNTKIKGQGENVLIQIFSGILDVRKIKKLQKNILEEFPKIKIIGSSTSGEILNQKILNKKIVISVSIFEKTKIHSEIIEKKDCSSSFEMGERIAKKLNLKNEKLVITFATGISINGEEFLKGIEKIAPKITVSGGLAGDNQKFKKTFVFNEKNIITCGATGVILKNKNLQVSTSYNFGWKNIGKKLKVTKCNKNQIFEIEKKPVMEIYKKYLGDEITKNFLSSAIKFPLITEKNGFKTARVGFKKISNNSLVLGGNLKKGDEIQFGYGNVNFVLNAFKDNFEKLKKKPSESIFIYSCVARKFFLGEEIFREIIPMTSVAPVCGFFTYGEFFHHKNSHEFLNETMTILSISESKKLPKIKKRNLKIVKKNSSSDNSLEVLSHLTKVVTDELDDLNKNLENRINKKTKKLQKSYEELKKLNDLKNNIISIASHELRTPMTIIKGYVSLFLEDAFGELTNEQKVEMQKVFDSTNQLIEMINNMLDTEKLNFTKNAIQKKPVEIHKIVKNLVEEFEKVFSNKKNISIDFLTKVNNKIFVLAEEEKIFRVFKNLIGNAYKFTNHGGKIIVETSFFDKNNDFLQIKVEDNGIGIPKEKHKIIFEKFEQVNNNLQKKEKGTGLGLPIVKNIIEELEGDIWLESDLNQGSKFFFTLPLTSKK